MGDTGQSPDSPAVTNASDVPPARRYPALDLLRVVAIGMTMMAHTPSLTAKVFFLRPFANSLWLGVDLFMIISGWLLGGQLLREAQRGVVQPLRFYTKRWFRTLPPYYFMLLVLYLSGNPQFGGPLPTWEVLSHLFFLQTYWGPNLYMVSWSLCVEEHFYLLLPALVALLAKRPRLSTIVALVSTVELAAVAMRYFHNLENPLVSVPMTTHVRSHGLFVGLMLSWVSIHRPVLWERAGRGGNIALALGATALLLLMQSVPAPPSRWAYIVVPTVGTWALALIFLACVHERAWASRINFRGLRYMGELTFAMYLVHDVIPRAWLGGHAGDQGVLGVLWRITLVIGLSVLLLHLVERPALRVREHILNRWKAAPTTREVALVRSGMRS